MKGLGSPLIIILIVLIGAVGYFAYKNFIKPQTPETSVNQSQTLPDIKVNKAPQKGTIRITDLKPPDFTKQQLNNLKLDKSKIDAGAIKTKQGGLITSVFAAEELTKAVYKVKRNSLTSDQAIALAKEWGFTDSQLTKKDIRNEYEYFLDWGELNRGNGAPEDPAYQAYQKGEYNLLWIDLVWDKAGKYGGGPYNRSSLTWHKSTAGVPDSPTPSKDEATKIVVDFLKSKNLLPEGDLKITVLDKNDASAYGVGFSGGTNTRIFISRSIDGMTVVDGGVSLRPGQGRLWVGLRGNQVIELTYEELMTQIDYQAYDFFPIKSVSEAYDDLTSSKTIAGTVKFTNTFLVNGKETQDSFNIDIDWSRNQLKDLKVKDSALAYFRNENQTNEPAGNYYQPVYVFDATGTVSGDSFPQGEKQAELTFYVPAVRFNGDSAQPIASPSATN